MTPTPSRAGGVLRTSTRPTVNTLLLLCASASAFTLEGKSRARPILVESSMTLLPGYALVVYFGEKGEKQPPGMVRWLAGVYSSLPPPLRKARGSFEDIDSTDRGRRIRVYKEAPGLRPGPRETDAVACMIRHQSLVLAPVTTTRTQIRVQLDFWVHAHTNARTTHLVRGCRPSPVPL